MKHIRTSAELKELSLKILAQSRERAQKEEEALRRLLGKRIRQWIIEQPECAQEFLRWMDVLTTEPNERRILTEVLRGLTAGQKT